MHQAVKFDMRYLIDFLDEVIKTKVPKQMHNGTAYVNFHSYINKVGVSYIPFSS